MKDKKLLSDMRGQMPDECGDFWAELEEAPINIAERPRFSTRGTLRALAAVSLAAAVIVGSLFALNKFDIAIFKGTSKTADSGAMGGTDTAVLAEAAALAEKLYKYRMPAFGPDANGDLDLGNLKGLLPLLPAIEGAESTDLAFTFLYASLSDTDYVGLQKGEPFHIAVYCPTTEQTARQYMQPGNDDALLCNAMLLFSLVNDLETVTFRFGNEMLFDSSYDVNNVIASSFSAKQYKRTGNPGGKAAAAGYVGLRDVREYAESLNQFAVLVEQALAIKNAPHQIFTISEDPVETTPDSSELLFEDDIYRYQTMSFYGRVSMIHLTFLNGEKLTLKEAMARAQNPVTIEDLLYHELEVNISVKGDDRGMFLSGANIRNIYINNIYIRPGAMFIYFGSEEKAFFYFDMKQLCEITGTVCREPTDEVYHKYIKVGGKWYIGQDALNDMQMSAELVNNGQIISLFFPNGKILDSSMPAVSTFENWAASSYFPPSSMPESICQLPPPSSSETYPSNYGSDYYGSSYPYYESSMIPSDYTSSDWAAWNNAQSDTSSYMPYSSKPQP